MVFELVVKRHCGHVFWPLPSHFERHSSWNKWPHWIALMFALTTKSSVQITHTLNWRFQCIDDGLLAKKKLLQAKIRCCCRRSKFSKVICKITWSWQCYHWKHGRASINFATSFGKISYSRKNLLFSLCDSIVVFLFLISFFSLFLILNWKHIDKKHHQVTFICRSFSNDSLV